jgi:hypothetical protein
VSRRATRRLVAAALSAVLAVAVIAGTLAFADRGDDPTDATAVTECTGAAAIDFDCYQRRYHAMVARRGARAAISELHERSTRVGYLRAACHQLMHGIGRDAGRRSGVDAFAQGDDSCSSGFFHGIVESVMTRMGAREARRHPERVCAPFRRNGSQDLALYNCVHGMGHGFMVVFGTDIFPSLEGCDRLTAGWERRHCVSGVFMENLTAMSNPERPSRQLRPEQPLYPCTAVAPRFKHECYIKQTAYALYVRDHDFGAVFRLCARTPDVDFRDDCYQGVGGDGAIRASKYVTGANATRATTRALCRQATGRTARRNCVVGAVTVTVRDGASKASNPAAFCQSFRETYLRAACARAHLKTAREFTSRTARKRSRSALSGGSPLMLCRMATGLEPASTRAPTTTDEGGS